MAGRQSDTEATTTTGLLEEADHARITDVLGSQRSDQAIEYSRDAKIVCNGRCAKIANWEGVVVRW